ncbi:PH domain-containing protein [Ornithinimicrobium ciconiae]|uniref:PH domain-containing protein n=1 Tax=Ornithinimicrobium ciconiae TaxID=2594265 RepID=UPI0013FCF52E|nr:PH domain-containing protein [Ornithinimicrobium ciconiae]
MCSPAWADVEELRADPPDAWAADVQARLADGSTVTLPAVPAADLPRLEALRSEV